MKIRSHSLFTDSFILKFHEKCCHSGVNAALNLLPTKFWITRGRQTVLKNCISIWKNVKRVKLFKEKLFKTVWLKFWLQCNHAFEDVGLNYAGPKAIPKNVTFCYLLLPLPERYPWNYHCVKSVQIRTRNNFSRSVCTDVSAAVLILVTSRFSSCRGLPKSFVSNNVKPFEGAAKL